MSNQDRYFCTKCFERFVSQSTARFHKCPTLTNSEKSGTPETLTTPTTSNSLGGNEKEDAKITKEEYLDFLISELGEESSLLYLISPRDAYLWLSPYEFIQINPSVNIDLEYKQLKSILLGELMGS